MSRKVAYCGVLTALAMILGYVEMAVNFNFAIPGIKLGLANVISVIGLYILSPGYIFVILISRIMLSGLLFGNMMSITYSLAGGLLSLVIMVVMKKMKIFSVYGISMAGAVSHNIAQVLVASVYVNNIHVMYYTPVLLIAGVVTGFLIGIISKRVIMFNNN